MFVAKKSVKLLIDVLPSIKFKVILSYYHHTGAKRERMYSSYSFLIFALNVAEWPASRLSHALPPGKDPLLTTR
jgi:hypothetical protein